MPAAEPAPNALVMVMWVGAGGVEPPASSVSVTKEKPGFWTRRKAFEQVRRSSNIHLLPYSLVTRAYRCATRRFPRSPPTVDGKVKCSPGVQLSAFPRSDWADPALMRLRRSRPAGRDCRLGAHYASSGSRRSRPVERFCNWAAQPDLTTLFAGRCLVKAPDRFGIDPSSTRARAASWPELNLHRRQLPRPLGVRARMLRCACGLPASTRGGMHAVLPPAGTPHPAERDGHGRH